MLCYEPESPEELAEVLREHASTRRTIELVGRGSKSGMAGFVEAADVLVSTRNLRRLLQYEPRDLTLSVEPGFGFVELQSLLAQNGQMIALDPPFSAASSIGGAVSSNSSGPMRRAFGTSRDLVIGMKFATIEGKIVQTGGMVVKNVAGLDMGKLMIGSFGTLAAIVSLNFRLHSLPEATETYLFPRPELEEALKSRDAIAAGVLQPLAVDILSPAVALRFGQRGHVLAVRMAGREQLLARYRKEFPDAERLAGSAETLFWKEIQEFPATFLEEYPDGVIARVSSTLAGIARLPKTVAGWFISRAATGVTYFYFTSWTAAAPWWRKVEENSYAAVIEYAPKTVRCRENLWADRKTEAERASFVMMEKVKQMFDPYRLLNPKRLYGKI
jgi:glycolate oxidase FAD binding subunit